MKQMNNMKNSTRYKRIVEEVQKVSANATTLKNTANALPKQAKKITGELMPLLDSVAPGYELYNLRKGSVGYDAIKDTWGFCKEAEYVRREGGAGEIARKAGMALAKVSEVEQTLDKEYAGFASSVREKSAADVAGKWTRLMETGKYVMGAVAAGGAIIASLAGIPALGLAVAAGSVIAAAILSKGQRGMPKLEPREQADLSEAKRTLANLRLDLSELARN